MSEQQGKPGRPVLILVVVIAAGIGLLFYFKLWRTTPLPTEYDEPAFPLPGYSQSPYLNTSAQAHYIGTAACATCHKKNHQSYLLTAHSRALSDLDPSVEPPDARFEHIASGRSYRIYRKDGQFRHEEVVKTSQGKEIARVDLPIRYLIGSGNFCRSYLVEVDGFLHESPLTWYTAKKTWGMSPGYDFPQHWGFERPVKTACLVCHAGRVEPVEDSVHRFTFHEKAIGCENCHGPGSLHQKHHQTKKHVPGAEDWTIVNPARLSRSLRESICANCHQGSPAMVQLRGRKVTDFRPGMPLSDYRVHYQFAGDNNQMTVVGHVEQLRLSACYQKSPEMTCLTCHDPHQRVKPQDTIAFYRQKCLNCHTKQPCRLPKEQRLKKEPMDNCVACHMPRGDTEIPHIAFTHHRIGRHTKKAKRELEGIPELVPIDDVGRLSQIDQQRNLGLAYAELYQKPDYADHAELFRMRAIKLLEGVHEAGLKDSDASLAPAELHWKTDPYRASVLAQQVIDAKDTRADVRSIAQLLRADCERQFQGFSNAVTILEDLVKHRRFAEDWRLLGISYLDMNQPEKALPALQKALEIRPTRHTTHLGLAEVYRQLGDMQRAQEHLDKARWLQEHRQD